MTTLLEIDGLSVAFAQTKALDNVSLSLAPGERLGLVGESGSGKSTLGMAVLDLLPDTAQVSGTVMFKGRSLPWSDDKAMSHIRGRQIGFVVQDPISAFSPVHTIGTHLVRAYRAMHPGASKREAEEKAVARMEEVEITNARARLHHYPSEYSGGMLQRVMIAAALVGEPDLLIADEPTTALDVTTQAAILDLLRGVVEARGMGLILVTHDLGVVAELCDSVAVMYRGTLVDRAAVAQIHDDPHPYTDALLQARPRPGMKGQRLVTVADVMRKAGQDA